MYISCKSLFTALCLSWPTFSNLLSALCQPKNIKVKNNKNMNKQKKKWCIKKIKTNVPEKKKRKTDFFRNPCKSLARRSIYPRKTTSLSFYKYIFYIFLIYFLFSIKVWTSAMIQSHGTFCHWAEKNQTRYNTGHHWKLHNSLKDATLHYMYPMGRTSIRQQKLWTLWRQKRHQSKIKKTLATLKWMYIM